MAAPAPEARLAVLGLAGSDLEVERELDGRLAALELDDDPFVERAARIDFEAEPPDEDEESPDDADRS
ncbi:MAG: hypothetical protein ACRDMX_02060 [Solirubrobacteraceae bacterium]